jgi:hypothetical protein
MVYAPGHFQEVAQPRRRSRTERISVRVFALVTLMVLALVVYSLTTHQRKSANGCIDFNYTTMIGGAEMSKCGAAARRLCSTPPTAKSIDGDFQTELYAACRKAGIPTAAG